MSCVYEIYDKFIQNSSRKTRSEEMKWKTTCSLEYTIQMKDKSNMRVCRVSTLRAILDEVTHIMVQKNVINFFCLLKNKTLYSTEDLVL
jgi:hypothetical protein